MCKPKIILTVILLATLTLTGCKLGLFEAASQEETASGSGLSSDTFTNTVSTTVNSDLVAIPKLNPAGGPVPKDTFIEMTTETTGANIYITMLNTTGQPVGDKIQYDPKNKPQVVEPITIEVYAEKDGAMSEKVTASYTIE